MMAHPVASFVEAQGALGRAGTLQHQLRGTQPDLQIDESVYDTGLDLSRPLPPNWRFSETATPPINALTAVAILVVLVRLIWALLLDQGGDRAGPAPGPITRAAARQLGIDFQARARCLGNYDHGSAFRSRYQQQPSDPQHLRPDVLAASMVLISAFLRCRHLVTAPGAAVEHRSWPPALGFAGLTSLAGVAFLPLPHLQSSAEADPRVRWAGPRLLAAVTMLLLIAAAVTSNPVSRAIAINCTAMLASSSCLLICCRSRRSTVPSSARSEPRQSSPSCSLRPLPSSRCAGSDLIIRIATRFRWTNAKLGEDRRHALLGRLLRDHHRVEHAGVVAPVVIRSIGPDQEDRPGRSTAASRSKIG